MHACTYHIIIVVECHRAPQSATYIYINSRKLAGRRVDRPPFPTIRHLFIANTGELSIQLQDCIGQTYKFSRVHNKKWSFTSSLAIIGHLTFIGGG